MATHGIWPVEVFFDGACPLCRGRASAYGARDRYGRIKWVDISRADFSAEAYGLDAGRLQEVMHAKTADGRVYKEVGALVKIWEALPGTFWTRVARAILKVPGMLAVAGVMYRAFARNRYRLTGRCRAESCAMEPPGVTK